MNTLKSLLKNVPQQLKFVFLANAKKVFDQPCLYFVCKSYD